MRRDADRALRHRDAELLAHLPRHPRIEGGQPGPSAFVEPAQHEQIGLLQPCLDEAPDREAGMPAKGGADNDAGGQRLEQRRVMPRGDRRKVARRIDQLVAEPRRGLAGCLLP